MGTQVLPGKASQLRFELPSFNPRLMIQFARRLRSRARLSLLVYTTAGALLGAVVAPLLVAMVMPGVRGEAAAAGAAMVGGFGLYLGWQRGLLLELQCQMALCQLSIARAASRSNGIGQGAPPLEEELMLEARKAVDFAASAREARLRPARSWRRTPRLPVVVPVETLHRAEGLALTATDLNLHGLFLRSPNVSQLGQLFDIAIELPERRISMLVSSRFVGETVSGFGMGVEIFHMEDKDWDDWRAYYGSLQKTNSVAAQSSD